MPHLRVRRRIRVSESALVDVAYDSSGGLYGTDDGGTLHRVRDGAEQPLTSIHGRLWAVAVSTGGSVAYGGEGSGVRVLAPGDRAGRAPHLTSQTVLDLAWSPAGSVLAAGLDDGSVRVLRGGSSRVLHKFDAATLAVAWSPSGRLLAASSYAGEGGVWAGDGRSIRILRYPADDPGYDMNGICWVGEHLIATASQDGSVRIWRLRDGKIVRRLAAGSGWQRPVVPTAGGRLIAHAGLDGMVMVNEVATGRTVGAADTAGAAVWGLAAGPGDRVLAVAAGDGIMRELLMA